MGVVGKVRYLRKGLSVKRGIYLGLIALLVGVLVACSSIPQVTSTSQLATGLKSQLSDQPTPESTAQPTTVASSGCKTTNAAGHPPKVIAAPTSNLKETISSFTLVTNCGDIEISVDQAKAPKTITALTTLARGGYFDGSLCHRLTTTGFFVLQCGDPTATGSGGPGFTVPDENLPTNVQNNYPAGTVAMANSGPNTNGSQFFLVFADTTLGPDYTIWGKITSGLDIVKSIAAASVVGGGTDGTPVEKIAIEKVIVK